MGNQSSFQQHHDFKDIATNYDYQRKFNDKRFGEIKLYKEKGTDKKIFQKDLSLNSPQEFEEQVNRVRDASALAHANLLQTYGYNSKKDEIFCADFYKLSIFFESFETDLEQEIARRARNKEYFPETELWYLLDSVAAACSYLQTNQIPHKDIRPFNIFLTANGDYKISAGNSFQQSTEPTFYENFSRPESRAHNYSPELLRQVTLPLDKRTKFDQYRSDIFSLGLTIVEAGNLERPEVYDYERKEVREAAIHESLNKLRTRYSENLVRTVEAALRVDPEHRLDFNVLERERGVYRRSIREKARGPEAVNYSPVKTTGQQEHRTPGERVLRSGAPGHQEHVVPTYPGYQSDDIDARVREAVIRSEAVIKRSSPTKYANSKLDPYIQRYLRNDLAKDQSLLVAISPHLTSESKYTTTLTIEQPNYGRESQPLNFGQDVPESVKKSSYVEPAPATHHSQVNAYGQPGVHSSQVNAYGQPGVHSSQVHAYGQPGVHSSQVHAHTAYGQPAGASTSQYYGTTGGVVPDYGQVATKLSQTHTYGTASGLGQNYGVTHQPTYIPAGNLGTSGLGHQAYNVTSIHHSSSHTPTHGGVVAGQQKDYSHEADELTRRIAERLNQSKQQF